MVLDHETWYSNGLFIQSAAAGCQVLAGTEHTTVNKTVPVDGCAGTSILVGKTGGSQVTKQKRQFHP